jgi:hypothetical protein
MVVEKINRNTVDQHQDSRIWLCMKNASFDDEMKFAIGFEGMNLKGLYSISRIWIKDLQRK